MFRNKKIVRHFTPDDLAELTIFEDQSNANISEFIGSDLDFGLFINGSLVGHCTLGYADDGGLIIQNHKDYSSDARILSQVFIGKNQRNKGFARYMLTKVLKTTTDVVYLVAVTDDLVEFYSSLGFKVIENNIMVLSN